MILSELVQNFTYCAGIIP